MNTFLYGRERINMLERNSYEHTNLNSCDRRTCRGIQTIRTKQNSFITFPGAPSQQAVQLFLFVRVGPDAVFMIEERAKKSLSKVLSGKTRRRVLSVTVGWWRWWRDQSTSGTCLEFADCGPFYLWDFEKGYQTQITWLRGGGAEDEQWESSRGNIPMLNTDHKKWWEYISGLQDDIGEWGWEGGGWHAGLRFIHWPASKTRVFGSKGPQGSPCISWFFKISTAAAAENRSMQVRVSRSETNNLSSE